MHKKLNGLLKVLKINLSAPVSYLILKAFISLFY